MAVGVPRFDQSIELPSMPLILQEKRLLGTVYGSAQVNRDFPRLISLVEQGRLDLGEMVPAGWASTTSTSAFRAMQAGEVIRSVIQ